MKKILILLTGLAFCPTLFADPYTPKKLPSLRSVEDFNSEEVGKFPGSFRTYPFQRSKAMKVYTVRADSTDRYLSAVDKEDISVQTFKKFLWERQRWPFFSWRWRAQVLPVNAAENDKARNDSACGVYVVFGGYTGKILKYVWSTTLPVGSIIEKKPDKFYFVVLESGSGSVGQWKTAAVNILEDYRKAFKSEPAKDPDGFGILTDGNATHTPAACDYDDFKISETAF